MGSMSLMHWMVVLAIVLLLFGAGKLPRVMGDFAKGIKAFKAGMKEPEDETAATPPPQVPPPVGTATSTAGAAPAGAAAATSAAYGSGERPRDQRA
jgi:sec-independent protein translocase protein TatA